MLPSNDPDRAPVAFDDHRLVSSAGLILPVTLAYRDRHWPLRDTTGFPIPISRAPNTP